MSSTSDKKHARAIVDRHGGVKYTEALRFVAQLKEMRERNESRAALGMDPVAVVDPQEPAWKVAEVYRFLAPAGAPGIRAGGVGRQNPGADGSLTLDERHDLTGSREVYRSWFERTQRAARVSSGRARDVARGVERIGKHAMEDFIGTTPDTAGSGVREGGSQYDDDEATGVEDAAEDGPQS